MVDEIRVQINLLRLGGKPDVIFGAACSGPCHVSWSSYYYILAPDSKNWDDRLSGKKYDVGWVLKVSFPDPDITPPSLTLTMRRWSESRIQNWDLANKLCYSAHGGPGPPPPTHKGKQLWLIITWNAMIVVTGNQGHVIILILTWDSWWEGNQLPALSSRSLSRHCHTWEPGPSLGTDTETWASISLKTAQQIPVCRALPCFHPEIICFCWMNRVLRTLYILPHHLCLMNP